MGSNVDLFSNQEADFEAENLSPNGDVGSVLNIFLHKITHTIDECSPNTNVGSWGISAHCAVSRQLVKLKAKVVALNVNPPELC